MTDTSLTGHPYERELLALRAYAQAERARLEHVPAGERRFDRARLKAVFAVLELEPGFFGIDPACASDAELLAQLETADESMSFAPVIEQALADLKEGRLVELDLSALDADD